MKRLRGDESGAIAVLLAIVLSFALIPLAGSAISAFVREGTVSELQRSADSGALAGARAISLSDLPVLPPPLSALATACSQAEAAAAADDGFGGDYAGSPSCTSEYVPDPNFSGALNACASNVLGAASVTIPPEITSLPGWDTFAQTYPDIVEAVERRIQKLTGFLARTVPAITKPGVRVTLTRSISGSGNEIPAEGVTRASLPETETRTATARRRIKNIALLPIVYNPVTGEYENSNEDIPSADEALAALEALEDEIVADPVLGAVYSSLGCTGTIDILAEDVRDAYNPGAGNAPTTEEIVAEAEDQSAAVLGLLYDPDPDPASLVPSLPPVPAPTPSGLPGLPVPSPSPTSPSLVESLLEQMLETLRIPFMDFVPLCVDSAAPLMLDLTSCQSADGALRATLIPNP